MGLNSEVGSTRSSFYWFLPVLPSCSPGSRSRGGFASHFPYRIVNTRDAPAKPPGLAPQQTSVVPRTGPLEATLAEAAARNHGRVVRANVQAVSDELAEAKRIINTAIDESGTNRTHDLTWTIRDNVQTDLAQEANFHLAHAKNQRRLECAHLRRGGAEES
jgi:hypothetical protein